MTDKAASMVLWGFTAMNQRGPAGDPSNVVVSNRGYESGACEVC